MLIWSRARTQTGARAARAAIALIAHDARKAELLELAEVFHEELSRERLVATATTGRLLAEGAGLRVECVASGPLGGDLQIGARVAAGEVRLVVFLRDPLNAHPHEPDIQALFKVCDAHRVPLATNVNSATLCLLALTRDAESPRLPVAHGANGAEEGRLRHRGRWVRDREDGAESMRILVGTDGSQTAERAVGVAARLAREVGGELAVVSAYRPVPEARLRRERKEAPDEVQWQVNPREDVEEALERARAVCDSVGVPAAAHAREGDPVEAIVGVAEEVDGDLLVVGNRGMRGLRRLLPGCVPDRVSHRAPCDVMIVDTSR